MENVICYEEHVYNKEINNLQGELTDGSAIKCHSWLSIQETARALHATGADIYITVRDMEKGEAVVKDILASSKGEGKLEIVKMELDSLQSIKEAAADFLNRSSQLNVLVNNAGARAVLPVLPF